MDIATARQVIAEEERRKYRDELALQIRRDVREMRWLELIKEVYLNFTVIKRLGEPSAIMRARYMSIETREEFDDVEESLAGAKSWEDLPLPINRREL